MSLVCYARIRLSSRLTWALIARRHNSTTNSSLIEDVSVPRQESPPQKPENDAVTLSRKVLERGKVDTSRITKTLFELLDNPPEEPEAAEQETVSKKKKKKKKNAAALAEKTQGNVSVKHVVEGVVEKPEQGKVKAKDTKPNEGKKKDFPLYSRRLEGLLEEKEQQVLTDLEPITKQSPISVLAHGLDRVLFNPGVHWLRDPRSRVYNFHPVLETIPKVFDFAFERLTGFVRSSRDQDLWSLARREGRQFGGSTSSLSGMLSQIYFLISENKGVDTSTLSKDFSKQASY
ncbi:hypothetical protein VNI00_002442 [Paramarasmius palmivorus]|uniref:Uncharacterized protein n=1 Tax=Paramarasmius palmivorus TaxID=297713 RepID=A0AAW0DXK7_9AGAR